MSATIVSSHASLPTQLQANVNPCLYTDVNGKEWITIFGEKNSYLYDLSNDEYQIFIDFHHKWTCVSDEKKYSLFSKRYCPYERSHVIDNNNHKMYVCDGHVKGSIFVFDIKDLPDKKYTLLNVIASSLVDGFEGKYQIFIIGHHLHFFFAAREFELGYQAQHCKYNLKSKKFTVIDNNFEQKYLDKLDFSLLVPKTKDKKQAFINNLKIGSEIDVRKYTDYYHATIQNIVEAKDTNKLNAKHNNTRNDKVRINLGVPCDHVEKHCAKFGYFHFNGFSSQQDKWVVLDIHKICDCKNKCRINKHQCSMPLTQSSFRINHKSTTVIYSKRYSKFIIVGRDKGLLCYKNVNYNWCGYYDNIDCSINGKQSYYKGNKADNSIRTHYFLLIVHGYLRNCYYNYGVDIPTDLYNIVLKYYYQSGDDDNEWIFVENVKIPLTCNCACVLVNDERDIIIIGENEDGPYCKIYKYNVDKSELIEIPGIEMTKQGNEIKGVYSKQTNRIYLFDRQQGTKVNSIDVQHLLQLSQKY